MEWKPLFFFCSWTSPLSSPVCTRSRQLPRPRERARACCSSCSCSWAQSEVEELQTDFEAQHLIPAGLSLTDTRTHRETLSERRWRCGCCPWFSSLYCTVSSSRSYKNLLQYGTDQLVFNVIKVKTCSCCVVKKYELYCRDACTLFLLSNVCIGVILILVFPLCALIFKRKKKSNSCNSDRRLVRDRVKVSERFGKSLDLVKTFFKNILIRP